MEQFLTASFWGLKTYEWIGLMIPVSGIIFGFFKFFVKSKPENKSQKIVAPIKGDNNHSSHSQKM